MRVVLQRVTQASVRVSGETVGAIRRGILCLVGFGPRDQTATLSWLADKCVSLRIFEDDQGKMHHSIRDVGGNFLVVSQFTLYGDLRKGNRPSFIGAAPPGLATDLYDRFCEMLSERLGREVQRGRFGAAMEVDLTNDGPVTLVLDHESSVDPL
jgi:D-aminoacyl-tRNA deacylase